MSKYTGMRYIPKVAGDWDNTKNTEYENLTVVAYGGNSYTSKKIVPKGIDITNTEYWIKTADYNAQVAIYKAEVDGYKTSMDTLSNDFGALKNNVIKPTFSFCFDDGYGEDDLTYSIFKEFGFVCSFALITDSQIGKNTLEKYRKYIQEGFSINSHSCTHPVMSGATMLPKDVEYEIVTSKNKLMKWGITTNGFVTPYSTLNSAYLDYVKNNYDYGFTVYDGVITESNSGYVTNAHNVYSLYRISLFSNTIDSIKSAIDKCIENNGCLFFYDHRTGATGDNVSESKLREVLTYIKDKVDNRLCSVKNNDEAISSYFSKALSNNTITIKGNNLAPILSSSATSLSNSAWWLSPHSTFNNETYTVTTINNEEKATIKYPSGTYLDKTNSLQYKLDLNKINMLNEENQTMLFAIDIWCNGDDLTIAKANINLEGRFCYDAAYDGTHVQDINITNKRTTFYLLMSPYMLRQFDYLQVYPRFTFTGDVGSAFEIYVANPRLVFANQLVETTKPVNYNDGVNYQTALTTPSITNATWCHYTMTGADNNLYTGLGDTDATIQIKQSGIYNVGIEGYFDLSNIGSGNNRILLRVMKTGTGNDVPYRTIGYYSATSTRVNLNFSQIMKLEKGDKITVDIFNDTSSSTLTHIAQTLFKCQLIK